MSHFPATWRYVPLESVADIGSGITKGRKPKGTTRPVPYLRVANVQAGHIDLSEVREIDATDEEISRFGLEEDDVLMTEGGDPDKLGRGALWDSRINPCIHQNHIFRVRLDKRRVFPAYFARLLGTRWAVDYFVKAAKQTTGIATINKTQLRGFPVPLPPLPEQKRIAAILDKADAIRRKRQEAIRLTEELLRSAFLEMFGDPVTNPKGWEVRKLGELFAERPQIGTTRPATDDGSFQVVRVGELGADAVQLERCGRVDLSEGELARYRLAPSDVLLVRAIGSEAHLGKCSLLSHTGNPVVFDSHVMRLRLNEAQVQPLFMLHWLKSRGGRARFMRQAGRTAVQFNINAQQISGVELPLPPMELQREYVRCASSAKRTLELAQRASTILGTLQAALTQRAFSGRL